MQKAGSVVCPEDEILIQLVYNQLPNDRRSELEMHLDNCEHCCGRIQDLTESDFVASFDPDQHFELSDIPDVITQGEDGGSANRNIQHLVELFEPVDDETNLGQLSHYTIVQVIGEGGMGVVFRAVDIRLDRPVAIKMLSPLLAANDDARERFLREARSAAAIDHSHVIKVYDVDEWKGVPFIVMQLVEGETLRQLVESTGCCSVQQITMIADQVCAALQAAHSAGVIHRDIKPSNILLNPEHTQVFVADFGLARAVEDSSITLRGTIAGTPGFMSPEQADGKAVDHRTDLFSLGSVLFFCATGEEPFQGESTASILRRVSEVSTTTPNFEEVPAEVRAIVRKLMARIPDDRYSSASVAADAITSPLKSTAGSSKNDWQRIVSAMVVCALLIAIVVVFKKPIVHTH